METDKFLFWAQQLHAYIVALVDMALVVLGDDALKRCMHTYLIKDKPPRNLIDADWLERRSQGKPMLFVKRWKCCLTL